MIKRILKLSYGIVGIIMILIFMFPQTVTHIYTDIPELVTGAVPAMLVMVSSYIVAVGGQIFFLAVSGTGSTRTAFRLELVALVIYTIYCTVMAGMMKMDVAICWTAEYIYSGVLLICSWRYMATGHWKNRRI